MITRLKVSALLIFIFVLMPKVHGATVSPGKGASETCSAAFAAVPELVDLVPLKLSLKTLSESLKLIDSLPDRPLPEVYDLFLSRIEHVTANRTNPLSLHLEDLNYTGRILLQLRQKFPLLEAVEKMDQQRVVSEQEYLKLRNSLLKEVAHGLFESRDIEKFFAMDTTLRLSSLIESKIKFKYTAEQQAKDEKKAKDEKEQSSEKEEEELAEEQPPEWNKTDERYKPENKKVEGGKLKASQAGDLLRTSLPVANGLLAQVYYDNISKFEMLSNGSMRPQSSEIQSDKQIGKTWVAVAGASIIDLPIPYGSQPMVGQYKGFKIFESSPGEFKLSVENTALKFAWFPMIKASETAFHGSTKASAYGRSTGIEKNSWPKVILDFLATLKGKTAITIAQELTQFLSVDGDFLYFSEGDLITAADMKKLEVKYAQLQKSYPTPVAMAHLAAFNCDGAAWIASAILRDFFQIPTRTVGGKTSTGWRMINGDPYHVVRSSDPNHMWIEVWNGRYWVPMDPTPKKNTPGGSDDEDDILREASENAATKANEERKKEQSASEQKSKDTEASTAKEAKEAKAKAAEEKEKAEEAKKAAEKKTTKEGEKSSPIDGKSDDKTGDQASDEISAEKTKITEAAGRITPLHENRYLDLALVALEQITFERAIVEKQPEKIVNEFFNLVEKFRPNEPMWKDALNHSKMRLNLIFSELTEGGNLDQIQWLSKLLNLYSRGQYRELYAELQYLKKLISEIKSRRTLTRPEEIFVTNLNTLQSEFLKIRHKDSQSYDIVESIYKKLPGPASRDFLRTTYGQDVLQLGSMSVLTAADAFKSGKLAMIARMAALNPFVDLLLNSERKPSYDNLKIFERSSQIKPDRDLVVARSINELPFFLFRPRAGENLFAPLVRGEQFALGPRETVLISNPKSTIERKVIVVYYDVSGSMTGDNIGFQDSLLLTILDKAFAEKDPFGKPVNQVYLAPFGDDVGALTHIKTVEQASVYINSRVKFPSVADSGTDIEKTLLHFYDLVARAHAEGQKNRPVANFKNATMVLLTDGGAEVNMEKVLASKKRIPSNVKVFLNFLAIGSSNPTLEELAKNSSLGSQKPFFRLFLTEEISDFMKASQQIVPNPKAFASTLQKGQAPPSLGAALSQLVKNAVDWRQSATAAELQELTTGYSINTSVQPDDKMRKELKDLLLLRRRIVLLDLPKQARINITVRVLRAYLANIGRPKNRFTAPEIEVVTSLKQWATNN